MCRARSRIGAWAVCNGPGHAAGKRGGLSSVRFRHIIFLTERSTCTYENEKPAASGRDASRKDLIGTAKYGTTILFTYFSECQHSLTYTPEIGPEGNLYSGGPVWTHNYYCSKCGLSGSAKCSNTSSHDHGGSPTWYTNTTTCKLCGRSATEGYQYGSGYWSNGYFSRSDQQIGNAGYKATGFIVRYVRRGSTGNDYWLTVPEINSVSNIQVSVNGRVLPFTTAYQFSGRDLIVKLVDPIILYPGDRISISLYAPNPSSEPNAALNVSSLSGY